MHVFGRFYWWNLKKKLQKALQHKTAFIKKKKILTRPSQFKRRKPPPKDIILTSVVYLYVFWLLTMTIHNTSSMTSKTLWKLIFLCRWSKLILWGALSISSFLKIVLPYLKYWAQNPEAKYDSSHSSRNDHKLFIASVKVWKSISTFVLKLQYEQ